MNNSFSASVPCPHCGTMDNKPYRFERYHLAGQVVACGLNICTRCGLHYVSPRLSSDGLAELYNRHYMTKTVSGVYNTDETVSSDEYDAFVKYAAENLMNGASILDVGCGVGNLLKKLDSQKKFTLSGVEISSQAAAVARENGFSVENCNLADATFAMKSFDCVMLLYVLEHVDRPRELLGHVRKVLKDDGFLMLAVPNYRYLRIAYDNPLARMILKNRATLHPEEHLQNFTPKTVARMVEGEGFEIVRWGLARPLRIGSLLSRIAKSGIHLLFLMMFYLGYSIGGIHLIARKKNDRTVSGQ